jgi:hypothetical protein
LRTWRPLDARDWLNRFIDQSTDWRSAGEGGRGAGATAIGRTVRGADRDVFTDPITAID